jgi:hypothetical protein
MEEKIRFYRLFLKIVNIKNVATSKSKFGITTNFVIKKENTFIF